MTAIPAAIDGLLALLRTSPVLNVPEVHISDGPWIDRPQEPDAISIGWLPAEGPTVQWHAHPTSLRDIDRGEEFTITGLVSAWRGDTDMKTARDRADALLEAIRSAVRGDPSLGGAVNFSYLAVVSLAQWQLETGVEVPIQFGIHAKVL